MSVTLREAVPADAGAISGMLGALAAYLGEEDVTGTSPKAILHHGFGATPLFRVIIAEEREPVGMVLFFSHFSTWRGAPGVYVQDLFVAEGQRGTGLGRHLLGEAARLAREEWGAEYMGLSVARANTGARGFYARLGFDALDDELSLRLFDRAFAGLAEG
ncbi:GNAT family N-acetyltransferase [Rhodalgimonas zhirmunskyi]|uniref:GNAT family N-acetyltransferase n=1 Tax=Rhodalgimonas zhirmunskyi TaxID=2964767 RepID=A0AAJ1X7V7_9RHOB|nr:GNAT family N-acetyltransferase [Rhodoalgimonas zhirmunskyi]MDQ2094957.1 GNAT family N-acetyltransferase [Rhodoalgimonas zhirmunskyi]